MIRTKINKVAIHAERKLKKKILITSSTFPLNENDPTPRFVRDLAVRLANKYRVYVLAPSTPMSENIKREKDFIVIRQRYFLKRYEMLAHGNGILENLKKTPILYALIPAYFIAQIFYIAYLKKRINFSLLNAHWIYPQALAGVLSKKIYGFSFPILCTVHGGDLFALKRLNRIKKWVLEKVDYTLVVGTHMKEYCEGVLGISSKNINVRSMGVDLEKSFIDYKQSRKREFLFVGRIAEKKGLGTLLDAVERLRAESLRVSLTVIGQGAELHKYQEWVTRNKLDDQITFLGPIPNKSLPRYYNMYKYFVFPSVRAVSGDQEGMPLSPIEAMGCGCVVIASSLNSASDYIENMKTGYIFEPGSVESLAQTMRRVLLDEKVREKMIDAAQANVIKKFDWAAVALDYQKVISNLVSMR